ncbi:MAG TPA: DUF3052 family protein [Candidatus Limnocylindrales bacterium]|jgi:hypothetical protein
MADPVYTSPLIDKLGVKPGARVAVIKIDDAEFRRQLAERTQDITEGEPLPESNVVVLGIDDGTELRQLAHLRSRIVANGAIWVVSRKGRQATVRDIEVMAAAKAVGLVDNKVVAFSSTHTSIRLVIPLALR